MSHFTYHMSYVKCLCWSLGHAEQLLFSCLCSKVSICNYVTCHMSHFAFHMSHVICQRKMWRKLLMRRRMLLVTKHGWLGSWYAYWVCIYLGCQEARFRVSSAKIFFSKSRRWRQKNGFKSKFYTYIWWKTPEIADIFGVTKLVHSVKIVKIRKNQLFKKVPVRGLKRWKINKIRPHLL